MRRLLIAGAVLLTLVAAYLAWPFYGLHQLGAAAASGDPERISQHADLPAIRQSIAGQMFNEGIKGTRIASRSGGFEAMLARQAISAALDGLAAEIVTPEKLGELLDRGDSTANPGSGLRLRNPFESVRSWYLQGPTTFVMYAGTGDQKAEWVRLKLRLDGLTWRLYDVLLPASVRARMVEQLKGSR